jgi:hypothetical protein
MFYGIDALADESRSIQLQVKRGLLKKSLESVIYIISYGG